MSQTKKTTYYVQGTHCRSCELLIEKEVSRLPGVKSVEVSNQQGTVVVDSIKPISLSRLNHIFRSSGYSFFNKPGNSVSQLSSSKYFPSLIISLVILSIYYFIDRTGIFASVSVSATSSLFTFFLFGLIAGISTCAALVGGLMVSVSRQGISSVVNFSLGRLLSFAVFGAMLGYFGSFLRLSLEVGAIILIATSIILALVALQMLQLPFFDRFSVSLPKSITRKLSSDSNTPILLGAFTFFLPCGFTLTVQSLALASSDAMTGSLIMVAFVLGTLIPLTAIGYGQAKSLSHRNTSQYFSQVTAFLILFFSAYTLYSQLNILDVIPVFSQNVSSAGRIDTSDDLAPTIDGLQILKMSASSRGYSPNYFKIKAGLPVRWEITDQGTSGCTNAVIARNLFTGQINLVPGTTSVKEFTAPTTPGTYRFSCWMGMINGTVEVVK